jgi:hypothetical protein
MGTMVVAVRRGCDMESRGGGGGLKILLKWKAYCVARGERGFNALV